jgi:predicted CoA-binding protein
MNEIIKKFMGNKRIALAGVSHRRKSFGNAVLSALAERGYTVFPIHPDGGRLKEINCAKNINELPDDVESLVICLSPGIANQIIKETIGSNIKRIWFQQGANFDFAAQLAKNNGMEVVTGKCILLYAEPVTGFHAFHRFLARAFGKL